jgi:hypothetical protein
LPDVSEADLNAAVVRGLVESFRPRVEWVSADEAAAVQPAKTNVTRAQILTGAYGYFRVESVGPGLAEELKQRWGELSRTNRLDALVLDLRYAEGADYPAAGAAADLFVRTEQVLLAWDETEVRSTAKETRIPPLAVLINHQTRGAAEALAAALREAGTALLMGSRTAGEVYLFREFPVDGHFLRIASVPIELRDGRSLRDGVSPDIEVRIEPELERIFYEDPYATPPGIDLPSRSTRPRINEADLVRMRQQGEDLGSIPEFADRPPPVREAVDGENLHDPVLVQALDVLKGIVIVGASAAAP